MIFFPALPSTYPDPSVGTSFRADIFSRCLGPFSSAIFVRSGAQAACARSEVRKWVKWLLWLSLCFLIASPAILFAMSEAVRGVGWEVAVVGLSSRTGPPACGWFLKQCWLCLDGRRGLYYTDNIIYDRPQYNDQVCFSGDSLQPMQCINMLCVSCRLYCSLLGP